LKNYVEVMADKSSIVEPVEGGVSSGYRHLRQRPMRRFFPGSSLRGSSAHRIGGAVYRAYLNVPPGSPDDIGVTANLYSTGPPVARHIGYSLVIAADAGLGTFIAGCLAEQPDRG